jgi:AcrR family transcriptional regulator
MWTLSTSNMSKSGERPRFHHGDLRNALLAQARRMVSEQGAAAFSLREAAQEIGVSPNAAYRHFSDRADILRELTRCGSTELAAAMEKEQERAGSDPVARLKALGTAYLSFALAEPLLFELMFGPEGDVPGGGPATGLMPYQLLSRAIDDVAEKGLMDPARRDGAEILFWPSVHGLATLINSGALRAPPHQAFSKLFDFAARSLGIEPPAR